MEKMNIKKPLGLVFFVCISIFFIISSIKDNNPNIEINSITNIAAQPSLLQVNNVTKKLVSEVPVEQSLELTKLDGYQQSQDLIAQYIVEFADSNYSNVLLYNNIISLCNGVPDSGVEFSDWLVKHGNDEGLDVDYMHELISECEGIESVSYTEQESLYWKAIDSGEGKARLALAKIMPFHSEEKVGLLMDTIFYSDESIELLAEIALQRDEKFMNDFHRYFWLSISEFGTISSDEFENLSNDFFSRNSMANMDKVKNIVNQWEKGNTSEKKRLLLELSEINAE